MSDEAIRQAIPHRPPFLFVDEIVELTPERAVTKKLADPDADFFRGHYPGNPLMPGVLICECAFQAGALLLSNRLSTGTATEHVPVLTRITEAKFKQTVLPGQAMDIEVTLDEELGEAFFMTGKVTVEGKLALRVKFACMMAPRTGAST